MRYRTILLAVDIDADNAAVIDYAFAFAEKAGAVLHLVYASPVGVAPGGANNEFFAAQRERAREHLEAAIASHRASPSVGKCIVAATDPTSAIVDTAASVSADLIIVNTHGRRGVQRLTIGSVAEGVLEEATVPVLVLKSPLLAKT